MSVIGINQSVGFGAFPTFGTSRPSPEADKLLRHKVRRVSAPAKAGLPAGTKPDRDPGRGTNRKGRAESLCCPRMFSKSSTIRKRALYPRIPRIGRTVCLAQE